MKGAAGKENGCQRIDTTMDALGNTIGCELFIRIGPPMGARVFADTVKDDDGFVHGITDDSQDGCQKCRINFQM